MTDFIIVVAMNTDRMIGVLGELPWDIKSDRARFKELTRGHMVLMGRKTWDSLPDRVRPLPDRQNLVITRNPITAHQIESKGAKAFSSFEEAVNFVRTESSVFVIGGSEIYREAFPVANRMEITYVRMQTPTGDVTRFPPWNRRDWWNEEYNGVFKKHGPWDSHPTRYETLVRLGR